eukprot:scaffold80060_cov47-Prasinocladus_malaysianus.AAC.1
MNAVEASDANAVEVQLTKGFRCSTLRSVRCQLTIVSDAWLFFCKYGVKHGLATAQDAATELILSAAQIGHVGLVNTLQRMGANLEVTDEVRGGRPLMHAATNGHAGAAAALLK